MYTVIVFTRSRACKACSMVLSSRCLSASSCVCCVASAASFSSSLKPSTSFRCRCLLLSFLACRRLLKSSALLFHIFRIKNLSKNLRVDEIYFQKQKIPLFRFCCSHFQMFENHVLFICTNMQSLDTIFHLLVKPTDIFAILNVITFTVYECRALSCNESFCQHLHKLNWYYPTHGRKRKFSLQLN